MSCFPITWSIWETISWQVGIKKINRSLTGKVRLSSTPKSLSTTETDDSLGVKTICGYV